MTDTAARPDAGPQIAKQGGGRPDIEMPHLSYQPADYADGPSSPGLANTVLEYTYSKGNQYRLSFDGDFGVSFQMMNDGSEPRGPLPYRCRELRPGQYLVHWLVKEFSIHVSLVIDLEMDQISAAAVMPPGQWEFFDKATNIRVTRTA
ncbi:MAG TPA: MoaF N-terminal domain-containing protein [Mycobacteriales bacterium]|jgi:hypothetical protein|nr:MoaF N-terminal domain-containing protein [Mycobacteriales bacterium]